MYRYQQLQHAQQHSNMEINMASAEVHVATYLLHLKKSCICDTSSVLLILSIVLSFGLLLWTCYQAFIADTPYTLGDSPYVGSLTALSYMFLFWACRVHIQTWRADCNLLAYVASSIYIMLCHKVPDVYVIICCCWCIWCSFGWYHYPCIGNFIWTKWSLWWRICI